MAFVHPYVMTFSDYTKQRSIPSPNVTAGGNDDLSLSSAIVLYIFQGMIEITHRKNRMFHQIVCLCTLTTLAGCFGNNGVQSDFLASLPDESHQVLLVITSSWSDFKGTMRLYSNAGTDWKIEDVNIPVVVGRSGLGWGVGLHADGLPGPHKVEGDGKAPAGIFALGTSFGYGLLQPDGCSYPYRQATEYDYFIDDIDSPVYNQWMSLADSSKKDPQYFWRSFERMKRDDDLYELGIVVKHNMDPVVVGRGSAIFLHIWRGPDQPTAGCTAMSKENLLKVMRWLDPSKNPILVQVPEEVLTKGYLKTGR